MKIQAKLYEFGDCTMGVLVTEFCDTSTGVLSTGYKIEGVHMEGVQNDEVLRAVLDIAGIDVEIEYLDLDDMPPEVRAYAVSDDFWFSMYVREYLEDETEL